VKRRANNVGVVVKSHTCSYFRIRRASPVTAAIILTLHPIPFRDSFRSSQLGIDLSRRGVRFGRALSKRRGRSGVVRFWETEAEDGVERLKSYEGEVKAIMIQFPTPYMLGSGNKQLPGEDDGFMVTAGLARKVAEAGARYVVIQSNVEDTALRCSQLFVEAGYVKVPRGEEDELFWGGDDEALKEIAAKEERVTERTQRWLEGGGEELMGRAGIDKGWRQTEERFFGCQVRKSEERRNALSPQ